MNIYFWSLYSVRDIWNEKGCQATFVFLGTHIFSNFISEYTNLLNEQCSFLYLSKSTKITTHIETATLSTLEYSHHIYPLFSWFMIYFILKLTFKVLWSTNAIEMLWLSGFDNVPQDLHGKTSEVFKDNYVQGIYHLAIPGPDWYKKN